jgi:RNA polymerase sigma-70 factor (ECF subfamily)
MADNGLEADIALKLERGDFTGAATEALKGYGSEIVRYLRAVLHDRDSATEVFSLFCELFWEALPSFRRESTVRTWAFGIAWRAVRRFQADPFRQRVRRLATSEISQLALEIESTSPLAPEEDPRLARLRAALTPEEQTLVTLRIDRELPWRDIAIILAKDGESPNEAALRKRFERLKIRLRAMAIEEGLARGTPG